MLGLDQLFFRSCPLGEQSDPVDVELRVGWGQPAVSVDRGFLPEVDDPQYDAVPRGPGLAG